MELRQLRYFLSVADARSFVGAANELFVSRQAVSKAVSQLEEELNTILFIRSSGGAFLTPSGMTFYDRVRPNVIELEKAAEEMRRNGMRYMQNAHIVFATGTLRLFEAALIDIRATQKNMNVRYTELSEENCLKQLTEHQAELAVCTTPATDAAFACEEVLSSRYGVLMRDGGEAAGEEPVTPEELKWLPLAGFSDAQTARLCAKSGLTLSYSGIDYYRLFRLAASGRCALILPEVLMPEDAPMLRFTPLAGDAEWRVYSVMLRSLEENVLYRTALDELLTKLFGK